VAAVAAAAGAGDGATRERERETDRERGERESSARVAARCTALRCAVALRRGASSCETRRSRLTGYLPPFPTLFSLPSPTFHPAGASVTCSMYPFSAPLSRSPPPLFLSLSRIALGPRKNVRKVIISIPSLPSLSMRRARVATDNGSTLLRHLARDSTRSRGIRA